ncbi:cell division initiation protein [Streptomyces sp. NPDC003077]|uniref:cell division initiation protein n=1 Tax=Streptomyces sp. NPDC003077 TaxID=3154443 RepID=UPI0033AA02EE
MDVHKKLDEILKVVGSARSVPLSASCVVNRAELLALLEELRTELPGTLAQARELLGDRERVVREARAEAERIVESARAHRDSLTSDMEVVRHSQDEAERIRAEARREAAEIRAEADDYVDTKLANFEVVLTKTINAVDQGREKLLGRGPGLDEHGMEDADAPEPTTDPAALRQRADAYVEAKFGAFEAVLNKTLEAVGRGRLKLQGARPADELGAYLAAEEGGDPRSPHTGDEEYLAGLAAPRRPQEQPDTPPQPQALPPQSQAQPGVPPQPQGGYQDPYGYQQPGYPPQQDPYGYAWQQPQHGPQPTQDGQAHPGYADAPDAGYASPEQGHGHQAAPADGWFQASRPSALDDAGSSDMNVFEPDPSRRYGEGRQ